MADASGISSLVAASVAGIAETFSRSRSSALFSSKLTAHLHGQLVVSLIGIFAGIQQLS